MTPRSQSNNRSPLPTAPDILQIGLVGRTLRRFPKHSLCGNIRFRHHINLAIAGFHNQRNAHPRWLA